MLPFHTPTVVKNLQAVGLSFLLCMCLQEMQNHYCYVKLLLGRERVNYVLTGKKGKDKGNRDSVTVTIDCPTRSAGFSTLWRPSMPIFPRPWWPSWSQMEMVVPQRTLAKPPPWALSIYHLFSTFFLYGLVRQTFVASLGLYTCFNLLAKISILYIHAPFMLPPMIVSRR